MRRWNSRAQLSRFMDGRYGADALGRFLSIVGCALIAAALLLRTIGEAEGLSALLGGLAFAAIAICYFRILSRNYDRRAGENQRYLQLRDGVTGWFRLQRDCFAQRRDYAFYRCPSCRQMVRVPKKKGRIRITCRRCGYAFERKT